MRDGTDHFNTLYQKNRWFSSHGARVSLWATTTCIIRTGKEVRTSNHCNPPKVREIRPTYSWKGNNVYCSGEQLLIPQWKRGCWTKRGRGSAQTSWEDLRLKHRAMHVVLYFGLRHPSPMRLKVEQLLDLELWQNNNKRRGISDRSCCDCVEGGMYLDTKAIRKQNEPWLHASMQSWWVLIMMTIDCHKI